MKLHPCCQSKANLLSYALKPEVYVESHLTKPTTRLSSSVQYNCKYNKYARPRTETTSSTSMKSAFISERCRNR